MKHYKFNNEQLKFLENKIGIKGWIKRILYYLFISLILAIIYYFVISIFFKTDQEKALEKENELIYREYEVLKKKVSVLEGTVENLKERDKEIYKKIFNSLPPVLQNDINKVNYSFLSNFDTISNSAIVNSSKLRIAEAEKLSSTTNDIVADINSTIKNSDIMSIPSIIPIRNFSIRQVGASIGKKVNPFYKTIVEHNGIDLVGIVGTEVVSVADGIVIEAVRRVKDKGNTIVIDHKNGYVTKYKTLGDILVTKGKKVKQGEVIARVGLSGMSFAPHLHYEVLYNNKVMNPINYFYGDLTPKLYKEMVIISQNTGQSFD